MLNTVLVLMEVIFAEVGIAGKRRGPPRDIKQVALDATKSVLRHHFGICIFDYSSLTSKLYYYYRRKGPAEKRTKQESTINREK